MGEEAAGNTVVEEEEEKGNDGVCWVDVVAGRRGDDKVSVAATIVVESLDGRRRRIMTDSTRPSSVDDEIPVQFFSSHSGPGFRLDSDGWITSVGIRSFGRIGSGRCSGGSVLCSLSTSQLKFFF